MHIHRREYLIAGAVFLAIGLFGVFTDRWESLFVFFILGVSFLATGFYKKNAQPQRPTTQLTSSTTSPDTHGSGGPRRR